MALVPPRKPVKVPTGAIKVDKVTISPNEPKG